MSLDHWSKILERQSEQRREREAEQTQKMLLELPTRLERIPFMEANELLDTWQHHTVMGHGYMAPRKQVAIFRLMRRRCRKELLGRLIP